MSDVFMYILLVIFLGLSIMLLMGKGAFLIAGYNTASKEQQKRYDEKKLCRTTGAVMLVITLLLALQIFIPNLLATWIFTIGIAVSVIFLLVVGNTYCKNKDYVEDKNASMKRNGKSFVSMVIGCAILIFACVSLFLSPISVEIGTDKVIGKGFMIVTTEIDYKDIERVTLEKDLSLGNRTNGLGNLKVNAGYFKNDRFGKYLLYSYQSCNSYVVMKCNDGTYLVVNQKDEEATREYYQKLRQQVK